MLAKTQRLTKAQFDHYFKVGKRRHSKNLQLILAPAGQFHGAAVVGKKVFKQAVKRNTMRRRLYGVLYRFHMQNNKSGVHILIAKPTARTLSRQQLLTEAKELLGSV